MRRLVICADGTWNRPDQEDHGVDTATNVTKISRAIRPLTKGKVTQVAYYHSGVGTGNTFDKLTGGAFGEGLDRNIIDCYRFLAHNYTKGDEIYLFGFSRGAYTVRSLAGLIRNSGLVTLEHEGMTPEAFSLYRDRNPEKHPNSAAAIAFRKQFAVEPDITCIGVWDTVGALGIPVGLFDSMNHRRYSFHDVTLSSKTKNAFHALAIDERRRPFAPSLWEQPVEDARNRTNWLEQAWFAGVHSNVGGGYADARQSDVTFRWMVSRVTARCGLEFDDTLIERIAPAKAGGKLYDSMNPFYEALTPVERELGATPGDPPLTNTWEYVHTSAHRRMTAEEVGRYDPSNLKKYLDRAPAFIWDSRPDEVAPALA
jgi:uncharacterized protein (DUF2235 family)